MLRDYFWSLIAVVCILGAYTTLMFLNKKSPDNRMETARASISIKAQTETSDAGVVPSAASGISISD